MDNQQIPKADSKFQKIARKNHRKWKLRLLSKGGQKADAGGSPFKNKPDYNRAKSAPPGFGGLEESEQLDEVIRKKDGKYCLFSKKTKRNLGCYPTKAGAMKRERQVQYFKHLKETIIREELEKALIEEGLWDDIKKKGSELFQKFVSLFGIEPEKSSLEASKDDSKETPADTVKLPIDMEKVGEIHKSEGNVKAFTYDGKRAVKYPSGDIKVGGTVAWRNNNPGNIRAWKYLGGIGKAYGFAVFETPEKGYEALKNYIRKFAFNNNKHTIATFMGEYAPTKDETGKWVRVNRAYAKMIATPLNVSIDTKTSTFKGDERALEVFARTVKRVEGWTEGKTIKGEFLAEEKKKGKDDRCVRIAKSKYDAWPSAYASGAVVKCRQGKIWKDIKEEEELDEEKKLKRKLKKGIASTLSAMTAILPPPDAIQSAKGKKPSAIIKKDKEELEEEWSDKYKKSINCKNPKGFSQRAHCQGRKKNESNDPKEGTGKKPKGSGRRLYTDENPKDTVSVKFSTAEDIRDTLSKESFKSKSHARQSQIINLIHQRVRAAHENAKDPETKARLGIALDYAEKRKEASKKKTASLQKEEVLTEKCWPGYTQKGMKTMFGKRYPNCVKKTNEEIELEERKLGKPSSETSLRDWFKRKGAPGKRGGWVDCNTCRNGKCSPCGRQGGEKRSKYPRCRPTPAQCKGYKRRGDNLQREE